ncbi:ROK family protein [Cnuibacter physcomitrellae]|uniref:ROK family protein n=1 Tax=Cnuibacter physcomitrellae TaxID=1619308 RepID=UPI002175ED3C|nr:ROK family protein [Cnuibacter physcomitrellae]MCS5498370.1 ROK family protein [Cnuibacter physcomitrellae]
MTRFSLQLTAPPLSARVSRATVASTLARLVASGVADSKAELGRVTGLSRTTVDSGVRTLLDMGALKVSGYATVAGRGRPADVLELDPLFGLVLVADCGASHASLAVCDLGQNLIVSRDVEIRMSDGPEATLDALAGCFTEMLSDLGLGHRSRTVVVGLPGPVDHRAGTVVRPPIMPGWDGYPIVDRLAGMLGGPVELENDVNLRALGDARAQPPERGPVLFVKVGTGIGAGIVTVDGSLLRGADGAAGDIGHVRVAGSDAPCSCGSIGCLEAAASVQAIGRSLGMAGAEAEVSRAVARLVALHDPQAVALVRRSAELVGEELVSLIHLLNPERVVVGGLLSDVSDDLLAGIRSMIYRRALPLATRNLTVVKPVLGMRSGIAGGVAIGIESSLRPATLAGRLLRQEGLTRSGGIG